MIFDMLMASDLRTAVNPKELPDGRQNFTTAFNPRARTLAFSLVPPG